MFEQLSAHGSAAISPAAGHHTLREEAPSPSVDACRQTSTVSLHHGYTPGRQGTVQREARV
jgi:hypothetical protein